MPSSNTGTGSNIDSLAIWLKALQSGTKQSPEGVDPGEWERLLKLFAPKNPYHIHVDGADLVSQLEATSNDLPIPEGADAEVWGHVLSYLKTRRPAVLLNKIVPPNFHKRSNSYLGGIPSLNSYDQWPYDSKGRRAFFVGQLDCASVNRIVASGYPDTGTLHFFMGQDIENLQQEENCWVVYQPIDAPYEAIQTVPPDYPEKGDWLAAIEGASFRCYQLDARELLPRIAPRMDLDLHKITTYQNLYEHRLSIYPLANNSEEIRAKERSMSSILEEAVGVHLERQMGDILGPGKSDEETSIRTMVRLFPNTSPAYFHEYKGNSTWFGDGYPWSRLHISRTIRCSISKVGKEFEELKRHGMTEIKDELCLDERFSKNKYTWGYAGIKDHPQYISDFDDIDGVIESVRKNHPDSLHRLMYWMELEQFHKEATTLFESFVNNDFDEPALSEKVDFVEWMAGWINYGCARDNERLAALIAENGYPKRKMIFELPRTDLREQHLRFNTFFSSELQCACWAAYFDATVLCIGHSAEVLSRIPQEIVSDFSSQLELRSTHHQCLGYGDTVQHAGWQNRDKVLLLQVRSDRGLFSNFGDGAIQFWIAPEDLAAKRFSKAFLTAECT